ncbi:site-specific integrase [Parashewanella spongiae]|uniref:Site-specific integrase n=1 Tax=Parashewanella spongiae TaxID=342950 RepID=A0A3A6TT62_9GAMM|nr:site-specific integrase [Parashewanella spongiae]MCL1079407.1 site-specific integrase [Parashewanella spongiae]RJY14970.1 site-specific integrase [Parashewanella spongiae]
MKLTIERKTPDSQGRQILLLTRYDGTFINEKGKREKKRKRQSLNLYIYHTPKDKSQRDHNRKTLDLAEKIRAKALVELAKNKHHFESEEKLKQSFVKFMQSIIDEKEKTGSISNHSIWASALIHLKRYTKTNDLSFEDMTVNLLKGFKHYLSNEAVTKSKKLLSKNTASSYFNKIRASINQAHRFGIIKQNPVHQVPGIKPEQNKRNYLIDSEITAISRTECRYDVLKRAFLFSCLTGIRWSDIQKLTWQDIHISDDGYRAIFSHKKTAYQQYLDLPQDALKLMGEPQKPEERVFKKLKYSAYMNVAISRWMMEAGITKNITFHCARHTFAVRMLTHGHDIYTVSKLLGHSELKTTQIYSDIIELKRKQAMQSLPSIFQ